LKAPIDSRFSNSWKTFCSFVLLLSRFIEPAVTSARDAVARNFQQACRQAQCCPDLYPLSWLKTDGRKSLRNGL